MLTQSHWASFLKNFQTLINSPDSCLNQLNEPFFSSRCKNFNFNLRVSSYTGQVQSARECVVSERMREWARIQTTHTHKHDLLDHSEKMLTKCSVIREHVFFFTFVSQQEPPARLEPSASLFVICTSKASKLST